MFSFKFQTKPITITKPTTNIVKATSVNKEQVELELKRLREIEENKKSKEIKRQKERTVSQKNLSRAPQGL